MSRLLSSIKRIVVSTDIRVADYVLNEVYIFALETVYTDVLSWLHVEWMQYYALTC